MNLFEFSQLLRRRKKFLIIGAMLIVALVGYMSVEYDNGLRLRSQPRYESSIQLAVVPGEFDSLGDALSDVGAMSGTAMLYATLLASAEAAGEVSLESGVQLLDTLAVTTSGRDGFINVKAVTSDPAGAVTAALASFSWLEQRVGAPPSIVRPAAPEPEAVPPAILNEDGQFVGTMRIEASPAYVDSASGLWVGLTTSESEITVSLADAADRMFEFVSVLEPDSEMTVSLQDVFGNEIDTLVVPIPAFPQQATEKYDLLVRLNRGVLSESAPVQGDAGEESVVNLSDPKLLGRHLSVSWEPILASFAVTDAQVEAETVGLLLLTDEPTVTVTGGRKGPVLIVGALVGGFLALISITVGVDAWIGAKRKSEIERFPIAELIDGDYRRSASDVGGTKNPQSPNLLTTIFNNPQGTQRGNEDERANA